MTGRSAALKHAAPAPDLPRFRAPIVFAILLLLFGVLVGRSLYLQWIDNAFLQEQGSSRYSREIEVPAHRGRIVDRAGEPLAISTPVKSIWAFRGQVDATPEKLALLAQALETTPRALAKKLEEGNEFVFLAKQVPPEVAERVAALKIKGVHDQNEYRRFYPAGEMASHIVGFTGDHDVGQEGIELTQQEWLGGKPGSRRVIINRRGEIVEDVESIRAPQAGRDLALAIDARLQYLAFRELKAAVEANRAKAGGLVVLDAQTGEILALANWPTYNSNARNKVARDRMRNRALTDVFEPGSTLKPFTIAAALESGAVRPDTVIQTAGGSLTIGPNTIHDAHPAGALTVEQVIQKSSNVGAAKIALSLPPATMWQMLSESGFGTAPNTGFPGEVAGRLRPAKTWKPIEQATMAYGHGISVNLVQLARAYTIFASDGESEARHALQGRWRGRGPSGAEERNRARRAAHAGTRGAAGRNGAEGTGARLPGRGKDRHRAQARGPRLHQQVRVVVRRLRAGLGAAARRRGDDRRALGRRALRRRRRGPGVLGGDGVGAAHARRATRRARRQRDPAG